MTTQDLKDRFRKYCVRIIRMADTMPSEISSGVISRQIIRSATSAVANYRAVCISKSSRDFINKLKIVEEELDETMFWLEVIVDSGHFTQEKINGLMQENQELLSIIVKSIKTARANEKVKKPGKTG